MPSPDPTQNNSEPTFGGAATIPPPEVFERAQQNNPDWYKVLYKAYEQFAQRPENVGIYADPAKASGATIQQIWLLLTAISRIEPYCVLAKPLPATSTPRVTRLVNSSAKELVQWLITIQDANGCIGATLAYFDGKAGHCITIKSYDPARDRFIYHDPWPERSLLAKENNAADVDALAEDETGRQWSVTAPELERVAFATFLMPWQWARVQGQKFELFDAEWRETTFFKAFNLKQRDEITEGDQVTRQFSAGPFKEDIVMWVVGNKESGKILRATLLLKPNWIVGNFQLAIDITKGFVRSFAPPPDQSAYDEIAGAFRNLRDPQFFIAVKDAGSNESDAMSCVQAYLGLIETAEVTTDFAGLTIDGVENEAGVWRSVDFRLM